MEIRSTEATMDGSRGESHDYMKTARPTRDGLRLVRRSDGFHWARPTTDLSDDICALCGYGPADVRGRGRHTAKYAVEFIARAAQA
jgi:hypothetical protein